MEIIKTKLEGVLLVKPDIHEDFRGQFVETYNEKWYMENGVPVHFVQDDFSTSSRGVLRGLHGDQETYKLVSCLRGRLYAAVLNNDKDSKQYGEWESFVLSDKNHWQVLVPPKFGIGHTPLSEQIVFYYKQSTYYSPTGQFTIRYDDPKFNIWWPVKDPILAPRDADAKYV